MKTFKEICLEKANNYYAENKNVTTEDNRQIIDAFIAGMKIGRRIAGPSRWINPNTTPFYFRDKETSRTVLVKTTENAYVTTEVKLNFMNAPYFECEEHGIKVKRYCYVD